MHVYSASQVNPNGSIAHTCDQSGVDTYYVGHLKI